MIGPDAFIPRLLMNITLAAWALSDHFFVVLFSGFTDGVYSTFLDLLGAYWIGTGFVSIYPYPWGVNEYMYKGTIVLLCCSPFALFVCTSLYLGLVLPSKTVHMNKIQDISYLVIETFV